MFPGFDYSTLLGGMQNGLTLVMFLPLVLAAAQLVLTALLLPVTGNYQGAAMVSAALVFMGLALAATVLLDGNGPAFLAGPVNQVTHELTAPYREAVDLLDAMIRQM